MPVNWALGIQQHNPGETFANAFQQGMQNNEQAASKNALATLVQNPNDPQALAALAKTNPEQAMQFRQQQLENVKAQLGQHYDSVIKGAEILRQFNPKDQQSYSQALAAAQQAGIDISQVPQQYNPQYVEGIIHIADAFKPQQSDPSIIREYDEATKRGLVPHGMSFTQYAQMRNPGMSSPVNIPYGATVTGGGAPGGSSMPTVATPEDAAKLPPGTQFRMPDGRVGTVPGGAGGNASGGFPRPY